MEGSQPFGGGLLVVDGPTVRDMGMPFTTRMTVVLLADGGLWIESPVPISYPALTELTGMGPVRYLVADTPRHVWRLELWHDLFPDAQLWAPRPTALTLQRAKLPLAGILGAPAAAPWAEHLDQVAVQGSRLIEEVLFLHKPSRTLIVGDLIQVHDLQPGRYLSNALKRAGGVAAPGGGTSRDIRATFWDRRALRASVARVLDWDFDKVVLAHGPCITQGARDFVEAAFAWALPRSGP
jgi:glyoxylase-like metal-dependent hydrolase (beta-lactamase superfamily II)